MDVDKQEPSRPRYDLESYTTSDRDDNTSFTVRRNGKAFYIDVFPSQFVNSPATTEKYLSYLIDNGQTACFFKPCYSTVQTTNELQAYKKITAANLDPQLHICRLHGVVMDDAGRVPGLLLSYIDHDGLAMSCLVGPDEPSASVRERWASPLDTALTELHKAGIVWGDVKAGNVLVDRDDNAWITDFGGGYTKGWVGKEVAGAVEGDLEGMLRLREFIFQDEAQDPGEHL